jgi:hypothetical protein
MFEDVETLEKVLNLVTFVPVSICFISTIFLLLFLLKKTLTSEYQSIEAGLDKKKTKLTNQSQD